MRVGLLALSTALLMTACEGPTGPAGTNGGPGPAGNNGTTGPNGPTGNDGSNGNDGDPGAPGQPGRTPYFTAGAVELEILGAYISPSGTATVAFRLTDGSGLPLDRIGRFTQSTIDVRFILAWLGTDDQGRPLQYTAYTTRQVTGNGLTVLQANAESNGAFEETGEGEYTYTFAASVAGADLSMTHAIGAYATRTVDGVRSVSNTMYSWVPNGGTPHTRNVVSTNACNGCHAELAAHGGSRKEIELCVLCHTPQTGDPDTGNTVDMKVMIHKIHRGADLPSVKAGRPYQIIGYGNSVNDYSTVHFPQDIRNCKICHQGSESTLYSNRPSRAACLACHDDVTFTEPVSAGMKLHGGGVQPDDAPCTVCHPQTGSLAGIEEKHLAPLFDANRTQIEGQITGITDTTPGTQPTLSFRILKNGAPMDIISQPLNSLRLNFAGPTTDYARYWSVTIQGSGASGTLTAVNAANGDYTFTPAASGAIPLDASGSYTVGMEGYLLVPPETFRFSMLNPVYDFAVTDTQVVHRRQISSLAKCEACHDELRAHGGGRTNSQYCVLCHNPNKVTSRTSQYEDRPNYLITVDFKRLIHKVHTGEALTQPYILGSNPGPTVDNPTGGQTHLDEVRFPGVQGNCAACHANGTWNVIEAVNRLPTLEQIRTCTEDPALDADNYCDPANLVVTDVYLGPNTAVCTSCHDTPAAAAHAALNTASNGQEACAVCHGVGSVYDVDVVHPIKR